MKASEIRLLKLLLLLLFLCGGAVLSRSLLRRQRIIGQREHAQGLRQMEASAALAEASLWQARQQWLDSHQPLMTDENHASQQLLGDVLHLASAHRLTVQKQQLHEPSGHPFFHEVSVTVSLVGDLPSVIRWLHALQSPESFRWVSQFRMVPDSKDPHSLFITARISRLHAHPLSSAPFARKEGGS